MWKLVNGGLIHTTDTKRKIFVTNISQEVIRELRLLAAEHDTHVNYLLETGMKAVLIEGSITFDKKARPKDRVIFNTRYDADLLEEIRLFAREHKLFINDVIEYCSKHIDINEAKGTSHRYRIEK